MECNGKKNYLKKNFILVIFVMMISFCFFSMNAKALGSVESDGKRQEEEAGENVKIENMVYHWDDVWLGSDDPWFILRTGDEVDYLVTKGFTQSLVSTLRLFVVMMSLVGMMISIISILFVTRSDQLKMKKDALVHKLFILLVVCSVIPTFNFLKWLFDTQFGM